KTGVGLIANFHTTRRDKHVESGRCLSRRSLPARFRRNLSLARTPGFAKVFRVSGLAKELHCSRSGRYGRLTRFASPATTTNERSSLPAQANHRCDLQHDGQQGEHAKTGAESELPTVC